MTLGAEGGMLERRSQSICCFAQSPSRMMGEGMGRVVELVNTP